MKKLVCMFFAALLMLSLAACGGNEENVNSEDLSIVGSKEPNGEQNDNQSALEMLTQVWDSYGEDEKFPTAGGDMTEENMTMDAPGKFGIDDTAALDTTLGFPASSAEKIDDAASLVHMMNANTFTCGAFHIKNEGDAGDVANAIKDNILQRHWLCGFPDQLVIMKLDDYVVSFFGEREIVETFQAKVTAAFPFAETICDEPIV